MYDAYIPFLAMASDLFRIEEEYTWIAIYLFKYMFQSFPPILAIS